MFTRTNKQKCNHSSWLWFGIRDPSIQLFIVYKGNHLYSWTEGGAAEAVPEVVSYKPKHHGFEKTFPSAVKQLTLTGPAMSFYDSHHFHISECPSDASTFQCHTPMH